MNNGSSNKNGNAGMPRTGTTAEEATTQASVTMPEEQVDVLTKERDEAKDRLLRLAAEYENYKKRTLRDMEDARFQAKDRLLRDFLPVMDNLDRALASATLGTNDAVGSVLLEGVRLVQRQFLQALEKHDIVTFEAQGQPFDAQRHEAIQQVESDTLPVGTVASVLQRGYLTGGRLLRPAFVAVVRAKDT